MARAGVTRSDQDQHLDAVLPGPGHSAWNALANLADLAGQVSVSARATSATGFDKSKLENGVLEPLRELGLIDY